MTAPAGHADHAEGGGRGGQAGELATRHPAGSSRPTAALATLGLRAAGAIGMTGVMLGAFGAHALRARISPELLEVYKTGVSYQLWHALALLGVSTFLDRLRWPRATLAFFVGGVAVFSGTLYGLAILGLRWLGAVTPLGGLSLIAGWATLLVPPRARGAAAARPRPPGLAGPPGPPRADGPGAVSG